MTTLLLSSRYTDDNQALWRAAIGRGWTVARARGIRLPGIEDSEVVIYVEALYAPTIARMIGRSLLELQDDWLCKLPHKYRQRDIRLITLGTARNLDSPSFVKPPNDKSFAAQVYEAGAALPSELDDGMPVLVAEPVQWESEFRCFCLDGQVITLSPYLRSEAYAKETDFAATGCELEEARDFAESVLHSAQRFTPRAVVIDVGQMVGKGWAVVEANAAWGSGIYRCDPNGVLDVIRQATIQPEQNGA